MHHIASVCYPTDLFCTNKNSIASHAPHRIGPYAARRIASVCNQADIFCINKNGIGPYEPHRFGLLSD